MIVAESKPDVSVALEEMQDLLRAACSATPHRLAAVRYMQCRTVLLESALRPRLPGFLIQCVSIFKFHDFICLYDPKVAERLSFVETSFAQVSGRSGSRRSYDVFGDNDF